MSLLARRYATALFLAARGKGAQEAVAQDLQALHGTLNAAATRALLASPDISGAERSALLDKLAAGRHPLVGGLLKTLQHRRRLEVLPDLHPAYRHLLMADKGEQDCVVETARPLDQEQLAQVEALAAKLSGRRVRVTVAVRPELLGGVRLRIGNELYDGSLSTALEQLERNLMQAAI